MEQCWNANPLERPDIDTLLEEIREIKSYYQNNPNELPQPKAKTNKETSYKYLLIILIFFFAIIINVIFF